MCSKNKVERERKRENSDHVANQGTYFDDFYLFISWSGDISSNNEWKIVKRQSKKKETINFNEILRKKRRKLKDSAKDIRPNRKKINTRNVKITDRKGKIPNLLRNIQTYRETVAK